ncbi:MAG: cytochrome d ubiquinol oxidase subunit II [Oligoflexia bacterium]|nr:cytochrome d ubiquinol oxidase subunit II [Oligoflexia bacterium]
MSLLQVGILFFLGVAILLYVLLAGADFGAGILELFRGRRRRDEQVRLISHAVAPVWEANHVWLILAVVILFVGFPKVYTSLTVYLHIPMLAVLVGIVARGSAFTFRHYDTLSPRFFRLYSAVFAASSLWTSFFLGVVAGASFLGAIDPGATGFAALYVAPWLNAFCLILGLFTSSLFAFLAALYLVGETREPELQAIFRARAAWAATGMVALGALVFASAEAKGLPLARAFFANPLSIGSFILATLIWIPFWGSMRQGRAGWSRTLGAGVVGLVICGWFAVQFPVAIRHVGGSGLTFAEASAPAATLRAMLIALLVGSLLIFPALGYLLKVFKWETFEKG